MSFLQRVVPGVSPTYCSGCKQSYPPVNFVHVVHRGLDYWRCRHCYNAYQRAWRAAHAKPRVTIAQQFWDCMDKSGGPNACWPWLRGRYPDGYGTFRVRGKKWGAHRYAWMITNGAIPTGQQVLHRCDNPPCCNPAHLFLGTQPDNIADMDQKGRRRSASGDRNAARLYPELHQGEHNSSAKLTVAIVHAIRRAILVGNETQKAVATRYGVAQSTVGSIIRGETWQHIPFESGTPAYQPVNGMVKHPSALQGSRNGNAKLDEVQVQQIVEQLSNGYRQVDIAADFGVSQATVSSIACGRGWKGIQGKEQDC